MNYKDETKTEENSIDSIQGENQDDRDRYRQFKTIFNVKFTLID